MAVRSGISTLRRGAANPTSDGLANEIAKLGNRLVVARVKDVCLNTNSSMFETSGEFFGIGAIKWEDITISNSKKTKKSSFSLARPLIPSIKEFPLVNEYVLVFRGPSPDNPGVKADPSYYYIGLKMWNDNEQNAYPDPLSDINNTKTPQNNKTYSEIESGVNMEPRKTPATENFNGTSKGNYVEDGSIQPILKNGQPINTSGRGFEPTTENINFDFSSLYLTSTQQIPIEVSTLNKRSGEGSTIPFSGMVSKTPTSPFSYNNPQIILNSGRLLFNSSTDNILFSSQKSILLDSNSDTAIRSRESNVNILTPKGNISLGGTNADEAVILGTTFIQNFDAFLGGLSTLFQALSKEANLSVSAGFAYTLYQTQINNFRSELQNMLSEKVKVK